MGESPSPPRFRIQLDGGDELSIHSVEALAKYVESGLLSPDAQIYDASTAAWLEARDASVVRFILEEMERGGAGIPPQWRTGKPTAPEPEQEPVFPPGVEADVRQPPSRTTPPPDVPKEKAGVAEPARASRSSSAIQASWAGFRRNWLWVAGSSAFGVALVLAGLVLGGGSESESGPRGASDGLGETAESGATGGQPLELALVPPSEEEIARSADLVFQSYVDAVDSLRRARGVPASPPEHWLGGNYLANAGEFPDVQEYWMAYRGLVGAVRDLEGPLFREALASAIDTAVVAPERLPGLRGILQDRHTQSLPVRRELYSQLDSIAAAALRLHAFLRANSPAIQSNPALSPGSAAFDPVLEVGIGDPAVARELTDQLDVLFQALDRFRGGDAPSLDGIGQQLLAGFVPS